MRISQTIACILCLMLLGCNVDVDWPKETTACGVTGEVMLDGQAIGDVKVVFVPQRVGKQGDFNRIASGVSNDRGEFTLAIDAKKAKQIRHGRYRVIVSKVANNEELFHESYNTKSALMIDIDSHEAIQRPKLELKTSGFDR